ncbi:hypothetical protein IQ216_05300 [Cyanobium sp. LEGE 06143]|uniref:Ycf66 family protein n=1 Tax=Cyanobium sp. LEGE 06143 TaxID=945727 RepID=UPI00187E9F09|nr:hypothetical protein [Cyanobium sp. LEGE 06143]
MVNASLNWASIVGIVLAVGGALLYFMRSFKPALARDYDVFFAAVGLLCGGILFFQGWRLDPILQFGQFLLAGTTVFFAYESVRLRGVTTEQARRSSYFDDDEPPVPAGPYRPRMGGRPWDNPDAERFDEPEPVRRRIPNREAEDDLYKMRRSSRAAIPERAASRRGEGLRSEGPRPEAGRSEPEAWDTREPAGERSRYSAGGGRPATDFGARRRDRDAMSEPRRGSRPVPTAEPSLRSSRRPAAGGPIPAPAAASERPGIPQGSPIRSSSAAAGPAASDISDADFSPMRSRQAPTAGPRAGAPSDSRPRDNASRFDD